MTARLPLACLALAVACGSTDENEPRVALSTIDLAPPFDWHPTELDDTARTWTPTENRRKESVTVIVGPPLLGTPERAIERTRIAQGALPDIHPGASTPIVTANGYVAKRFDATFVPDPESGVYYRSHVVVVASGRTVHVLYTAKDPEPTRTVLRRVVDSIQAGG